jgi:predicted TIM-barrel fold metal-dependent hydrolase
MPHMRSILMFLAVMLLTMRVGSAQETGAPILDMHLHAVRATNQGPPPVYICAPFEEWPAWDPKTGPEAYADKVSKHVPCAHPLKSAMTDDELMQRTLKILQDRNITGLASGPLTTVVKWKAAGGARILPATWFDLERGPKVEEMRALVKSGQVMAFAEQMQQYSGVAVNDPRLEPYYALAEELDVPVGFHMGPGPPGTPYFAAPDYRMRLSNLLLLEDVLVRHPRLRVWAMHAGWPLGDDAIAAMYAHPQLYVDVGVISYVLPKAEFYGYLKRLIDAGFENRIMFGSDQMVWPDALTAALERIETAPFLSPKQKRDILYNNAARFLRIEEGTGPK